MNKLKVNDTAPPDWQKYDICLVIPTEKDSFKIKPESIRILRRIARLLGKKYVYVYYSLDGRHVYALLRAGINFLRIKAASEHWRLQIDEEKCAQMALAGIENNLINEFTISHMPEVTSISPYEYLYAEYREEEEVESIFKRPYATMQHPFHKALRLKMLNDFFYRNTEENEMEISFDKLKSAGHLLDVFAIHHIREKRALADLILPFRPARMPIPEIQQYFGEEIAMYFSFLEHMFNWFVVPAIVGVGFQAAGISLDNYSRVEIPAFSFFTMFWMITAVQRWKKKQQLLAVKWDTTGCDLQSRIQDHVRFNHHGMKIASYVDGRDMVYFPLKRRIGFYILSFVVLALCLIVVFIIGAAFYYARIYVGHTSVFPYQQWVISGCSAIQIMICNTIFFYIAKGLTEIENHRLDIDYRTSLCVKVFFFQIANALCTFYYLGFGARYIRKHNQTSDSLGECGFENCMKALMVNVVTIVGVQVAWRSLGKYFMSFLTYQVLSRCFGYYKERQDHSKMLPFLGEDIQADENTVTFYDDAENFDEQDEQVFQHLDANRRTISAFINSRQQSQTFRSTGGDEDDLEASGAKSPARNNSSGSVSRSNAGFSEDRGVRRAASTSGANANEDDTIVDRHYEEDVDLDVLDPFKSYGPSYDPLYEFTNNYSFIIQLLAIVFSFGSALPGVYLIGMILLTFECRGHAWSLLYYFPRPVPRAAENIQPWVSLLDFTLAVAVMTNASLVILTMGQFKMWETKYLLLLWIGYVAFLLTYQFGMHNYYSSTAREAVIQRQRSEFIAKKIIKGKPDRQDPMHMDML